MPARRNKSGQFTKAKRRRTTTTRRTTTSRRRKPAISALKVAEQALVANAITEGMFNANLRTFITGKGPSGNYASLYNPSTKDNILTLPEMLGIDRAAGLATNSAGQQVRVSAMKASPALQAQTIKDNLMLNGMSMVGQVIAIPLVFKYGKKFLNKPLINPANRLLRAAGIKEVKV